MALIDDFESWRRRLQQRYHHLLSRLIRMIRAIATGSKTPQEFNHKLDLMMNSKTFNDFVQTVVSKMVTMQKVGHEKTWRAAAAKSSRGKDIYNALKKETSGGAVGLTMNQIIADNSLLIKTVPRYIAREMSEIARKGYIEGLRTEAIMDRMRGKATHLTEVQLRRIARTESSKAATALTQARCEDMGLDFYVWRSCRDERVRSAHAKMDGIVCRWSDPPNPEALFPGKDKAKNSYHPGGIYNCRCIPLPVIDSRDLHFPLRMHVHGAIVQVANLESFMRLANKAHYPNRIKLR